jgi:hypothetical protein
MPLTVLRHETNHGLGASLRTGISSCLTRAGDDDVLVTLDVDNAHSAALIPDLVARVRAGDDVATVNRPTDAPARACGRASR